jgi:hypothetical protein
VKRWEGYRQDKGRTQFPFRQGSDDIEYIALMLALDLKDADVAAVWQAILNGWVEWLADEMRSLISSLRRIVQRLRSLGRMSLGHVVHLRRLLNSGQDLGWLKMRSPS